MGHVLEESQAQSPAHPRVIVPVTAAVIYDHLTISIESRMAKENLQTRIDLSVTITGVETPPPFTWLFPVTGIFK